MQAFTVPSLVEGGTIALGLIGNRMLFNQYSSALPGIVQTGIGASVWRLGQAGLLGGILGAFTTPTMGGRIVTGGIVGELSELAQNLMGAAATAAGMGDYLTTQQAATAQPLGHMGDYLTTQQAATAQPLGDYEGSGYVGEELASM